MDQQIERVDDLSELPIWVKPTFEDFESVVQAWPYIELRAWAAQTFVAVGTMVGKTHDGQIFRRGCVVDETPFDDTVAYAKLRKEKRGVRYCIRLLHHRDMTVRWYTCLDRVDLPDGGRVVQVTGGGLVDITSTYVIPSLPMPCGVNPPRARVKRLPARHEVTVLHRRGTDARAT